MKNLTTKQKLEKIYEIMLDLEEELGILPSLNIAPDIQNPNFEDYFRKLTEQEFRIQTFSRLIKFVQYTNLPQIVSNEKYEKLDAVNFKYLGTNIQIKELYRGVREINHHANLLCDEEYHSGIGDACNGLFSSRNYEEANLYSSKNSKYNCVLRFKVPEIKIIDDTTLKTDVSQIFENKEPSIEGHKQILEEIKGFTLSIPEQKYQSAFFYSILNDPSIIAILLGYDAIYEHNFPAIAILNRGKIVVSEKEYERICNDSGHRRPEQLNQNC